MSQQYRIASDPRNLSWLSDQNDESDTMQPFLDLSIALRTHTTWRTFPTCGEGSRAGGLRHTLIPRDPDPLSLSLLVFPGSGNPVSPTPLPTPSSSPLGGLRLRDPWHCLLDWLCGPTPCPKPGTKALSAN